MSAYANDPRVVPLLNGDFMIAYTVRWDGQSWAAYNHDNKVDERVGRHADADDAIAGVIGAPR